MGYEFLRGGKVVQQSPGPVDRPVTSEGTWVFHSDGQLVIRSEDEDERSFLVQSLDDKRLVLNKTTCKGGEA